MPYSRGGYAGGFPSQPFAAAYGPQGAGASGSNFPAPMHLGDKRRGGSYPFQGGMEGTPPTTVSDHRGERPPQLFTKVYAPQGTGAAAPSFLADGVGDNERRDDVASYGYSSAQKMPGGRAQDMGEYPGEREATLEGVPRAGAPTSAYGAQAILADATKFPAAAGRVGAQEYFPTQGESETSLPSLSGRAIQRPPQET